MDKYAMNTITLEQLTVCLPTAKKTDDLLFAMNSVLPKYGINAQLEVAAFLSQTGHESCDYNCLEENLNYSSNSLHRVWPKRFPDNVTCEKYAHNPQMIANKVYADRMGNGNEASGDGWLYHGRGAIQLTGKNNYTLCATALGKTLTELPEYLITINGAVESAAWFWSAHSIGDYVPNIEKITKIINGGTIGIADRTERFNTCIKALTV